MTAPPGFDKLDSDAKLSAHLAALVARDSRLKRIRDLAGPFPRRISPTGFAGIAKVITGQQLSVASARAIWARFELLPGATEAHSYLLLPEEPVRKAGMSGGKIRTLRAVAEAVVAGQLDFEHVESLSAEEAIAYLTRHKGIGPWTAELYLMFCAGHPDVFPSGDLALQKAVAVGLGLGERIPAKTLAELALSWAPHRATAALLFWRYFAALKEREGVLL